MHNHPLEKKSNIRVLPIERAYNVRDMGGYAAAGNKTVKWRKVIRAGDLNLLTEADLMYFEQIPVKTYIDFRDSEEINAAPDKTPASLLHHFYLPVETGNIFDFQKVRPEQMLSLLVEGNQYFATHNQKQYREFFQILMKEENTPLLFHCSAGKDRTGFGAALFLSALGVSREVICEDYLLTNECLKDKYAVLIESIPLLAPILEARLEYIQAAFDVIDSEYGGMDSYLTRYLNVDLEKMRSIYLE